MPTAEFLRQKAHEVRALIPLATVPEVIAQLKIWASELEEEAAKVEDLTAQPPVPQSSRQPEERRSKRSRKRRSRPRAA
jgi:hypothetical protein